MEIRTKRNRFRVALSFAGEKRPYVADVARTLADRFGEEAILYDKFHEAEFAIYNLGQFLPKLYADESDLIVPIICPRYEQKTWTGWEWVDIFGLLARGEGKRVMPARFERAKADGLSPESGFVELDNKSPDQFAELILQRLALNEGNNKTHYTGFAPPWLSTANIDNNLPRIPIFFGRERELTLISEALSTNARGWGALIDGPGGIGKTALAIRAAELVPAGRFKEIFFLSSKERELTSDGQRDRGAYIPNYLELLNTIARKIGNVSLTQGPERLRTESILDALSKSEFLLIFDNLETLPEIDRDDVFAFLNRLPRSCSAIVTSRFRSDASALTIRLDRLDWNAARNLMDNLSKDSSKLESELLQTAEAIYNEAGGNPLLLKWVLGQVKSGKCKTVIEATDRLRNPAANNNPLEFIFGDLFENFTGDESKILSSLSLVGIPITAKLVGELSGTELGATEESLLSLVDRALVITDPEHRSFSLMTMVGEYLRRLKGEILSEAALKIENRAYATIISSNRVKGPDLHYLKAHWTTINAALPVFVAGDNSRLQTVCTALDKFLSYFGYWDEKLALMIAAEKRATESQDYISAGWRAFSAGWIYKLRGQFNEVLQCADTAESHWTLGRAGHLERGTAIRLRAFGYLLKKDYTSAIAEFGVSMQTWEPEGKRSKLIAIASRDLAVCFLNAGRRDLAEERCHRSLDISREIDDEEGIIANLGLLADISMSKQIWQKAEDLASEAYHRSEDVGVLEFVGTNSRRLEKILLMQGRPEEAHFYSLLANQISCKIGFDSLPEPPLAIVP